MLALVSKAARELASWGDPLISPLHAAHAGLPPLLVQAGTEELLAPDAGLLADSAVAQASWFVSKVTAGLTT